MNENVILEKFRNKLQAFTIDSNKNKIALAISGGSDSMALLYLAKESFHNKQIIALTVDHKLRKESAEESKQVAKWCEDLEIEHHILNWEHFGVFSNIQSKAREARYNLLTEYCRDNKIEFLFFGHQMNDQAETFLMRLERGSGLDGLSGMPEKRMHNNITIFRPLLGIMREELRDYLRLNNASWLDDPSNDNDAFSRVKMRNTIIDEDLYIKRVAEAAEHLSRAKESIERNIKDKFASIVEVHELGYASIDKAKWLDLCHEESFRIFVQVINIIGRNNINPRFDNLTRVIDKLKSQGDIAGITFGNCFIKTNSNIIQVFREKQKSAKLEIKSNGSYVWDDRFKINVSGLDKDAVFVDYISLEDLSWIKKQKIDVNLQAPKEAILTLPILKGLENLWCAPHINYRHHDFDLALHIELLK